MELKSEFVKKAWLARVPNRRQIDSAACRLEQAGIPRPPLRNVAATGFEPANLRFGSKLALPSVHVILTCS
jgi:hypothetical protein